MQYMEAYGKSPKQQCRPLQGIGGSVGNSHRSASPRPTTLEEDRELFVNFSLILCLWFEIQDLRTYNFFDWISNTDWWQTASPITSGDNA